MHVLFHSLPWRLCALGFGVWWKRYTISRSCGKEARWIWTWQKSQELAPSFISHLHPFSYHPVATKKHGWPDSLPFRTGTYFESCLFVICELILIGFLSHGTFNCFQSFALFVPWPCLFDLTESGHIWNGRDFDTIQTHKGKSVPFLGPEWTYELRQPCTVNLCPSPIRMSPRLSYL